MGADDVLIGRDAIVSESLALLAEDRAVLLAGEGGIGKSTLLRAVVKADGRRAHWGGGLETMRWRDYLAVGRAIGDFDLVGDVEAVASRVEGKVGPDLLVLDDLHLADEASRMVLAALVGRVAVIAATRPDECDAVGFTVLGLAPLDDVSAEQIARSVAPGIGDARLRLLIERAGGNPLLVEEFAAATPDEALLRGSLPRLEGLPDAVATDALRLALAGRPVMAGPESAALLAAGIASALPDGLVRIRHAVLAEALIAGSDEAARRDVHRALAAECEDPGEAARHWLAAGDDNAALLSALAAVEAASTPGERASHLSIAARAAHRGGTGFLLDAAEELSAAGRHQEVMSALASIEETDADLESRSICRLELLRARAAWHFGDAALASASARKGLALASGTDDRLEAALAVEVVRSEASSIGVMADHADLLRRAHASARRAGRGQASVLNAEGIVAYFSDDLSGAAALFGRGRAAAIAEGDVDSEMRCANNEITWHEIGGDRDEGLALASEMADRAGVLGLGEWQTQFQAATANLLWYAGDYPGCLRMLDSVDAAAVDPRTRWQARLTRGMALADLGLLDEASTLALPPEQTQGLDFMEDGDLILRGMIALWSGRPHEAIAALGPVLNGVSTGHVALALPFDALARRDLGIPVPPPPDREFPSSLEGFVTEVRGVTLMDDDPVQAVVVLDLAVEQLTGRWYFASIRARWAAAEARRMTGDPTAVAALLSVEEEVLRSGLAPLDARIRRSLRLAGVKRSARRALDRSGLVTEREREVVDLVARGESLAEIARRLGVGRPTVRHLLATAQSRLGADSRLSVAAAVVLG